MTLHDKTIIIQTPPEQLGLDSAVISAFGKGQKVVSVMQHGNSAWSSTARIETKNSDGTLHNYFLKIVTGNLAGPRVLGEYSCMLELHKTMPSIVPTPRASGQCLDLEASYFLCDYVDIDHRQPDPVKLGQKMAELHQISVSPTSQFGFHAVPYDGKLPLVADWDKNWASFYGKMLSGVYELDIQINGLWKELDDNMRIILETVVPRLLRPLQEDGRSIKACLIHGDLWEGNIGTNPQTEDIYVFDSCAYYAHHEMAIGMWRTEHHQMRAMKYRDEYFKNFPPDEPVQEFDDRNRLYCIKETIMHSAHKPGSKVRAQALKDIEFLVEKFGG